MWELKKQLLFIQFPQSQMYTLAIPGQQEGEGRYFIEDK